MLSIRRLFLVLSISCSGCSAELKPPPVRSEQPLSASEDAGDSSNLGCSSGATSSERESSRVDAADTADTVATLRLSEIVVDPPGTDGNNEYIELRGVPCSGTSGVYLVCIEGDSESNPGTVDRVIALNTSCGTGPCYLGANGLLVLAPADGWQKPLDSTATWASVSALAGGGLENGTTTLLLLSCASTPTLGADWDPTDSARLQIPSPCLLLDSIAWLDRASGDFAYSTVVVGPKPAVGAAVNCLDEHRASSWYYGPLVTADVPIVFGAPLSSSAPAGAALTPGMPNVCSSVTGYDAGNSSFDAGSMLDAKAAASTGGNASRAADASMGGGGASSWWLPDVSGTWPDASLDGSVMNTLGGNAASQTPPTLSQPSCSLIHPRRYGWLDISIVAACFLGLGRRALVRGVRVPA